MIITVGKLLLIVAGLIAAIALCIAIVSVNDHGNAPGQTGLGSGSALTSESGPTTTAAASGIIASGPGVTEQQVDQLRTGDSKSEVESKLGVIGQAYNHTMGLIEIPGESESGGEELPSENDCWLYTAEPPQANPDQNVIAVCFDDQGRMGDLMSPWLPPVSQP
jgi:hypothetical protein